METTKYYIYRKVFLRSMSEEGSLMAFVLNVNPATYYIEMFQSLFYYQTLPETFTFVFCVVFSFAILVIGWIIFHKLERDFAEVL